LGIVGLGGRGKEELPSSYQKSSTAIQAGLTKEEQPKLNLKKVKTSLGYSNKANGV